MNYIRGAVSAISAPYQYYKELPPINPSTLTGAIDVIVIQRPADNGGTELVCSPFHVRFGKWQVLRPGEKKVNVSVNGHPIPYSMKIGEAGEAFFVFETDDDIPDDLITSPLLQPTIPDQTGAARTTQDPNGIASDEAGRRPSADLSNKDEVRPQEPEFLDLNAPPPKEGGDAHAADTTPKQAYLLPSYKKMPSTVSASPPADSSSSSPPPHTRERRNSTPAMDAQDKRVDEALRNIHRDHLHVPEVGYHHDITLDAEGYHVHGRERSDRTIRSSDGRNNGTSSHVFPSGSKSRSPTPSPSRGLLHTQSALQHVTGVDSGSNHSDDGPQLFPIIRATSEPPPDIEEHPIQLPNLLPDQSSSPSSSKLTLIPPIQEYSWEWGAFPQPSPMKTSFGKGGRIDTGGNTATWGKGKGKGKASDHLSGLAILHSDSSEDECEHGRSRSVPPELDGSPARNRKGKALPVYEEYGGEPKEGGEQEEPHEEGEDVLGFGSGGRLRASKSDPTVFVLSIEGKKVKFELSLASPVEDDEESGSEYEGPGSEDSKRGRRNRDGGSGGLKVIDVRDEVEIARLFEQDKIDFERFMNDEALVNNPRLIIRWVNEQYITRNDGSPLMDALVLWRDATLRQRAIDIYRPSSPLSEEEPGGSQTSTDDRQSHSRSKSEPPEQAPQKGKPTSTSWVQWWSRSRRDNTDAVKANGDRPGLRGTASAPPITDTAQVPVPTGLKKIFREIPAAESAPAFPSTPVQRPVPEVPAVPIAVSQQAPTVRRKFAKTLRLTSDQLKGLDLKPGPNQITFSLSTTGVIACTARIFVWDSTDLVVVSDIDGTITKSDGLGHVFAMIGRDWTHLGVAKLYTDITRNGYKIMYLTSRAIGQADATRGYLKGIKQNDYQLPEGPVIMSPDRLMASLHREVIMRKPEVFKMACLRDIQRLFGEASRNPFYAGFGNRITDALSYRSVNVPSARIFTIDSTGEVKLELLELAGYKSSYIHMTDLVDQMFPPIHRKWTPEFTDFNYWKAPVLDYPLPDLSPPSPALSARSDTSNQSTLARLRNFSLVGSRQSTIKPLLPSPPGTGSSPSEHDLRRSTHLRQMSSFEKLSNTLATFAQPSSIVNGNRRSASPESYSSSSMTHAESDDEDGDGWELDASGQPRKRQRRRSMTSMPGTLDDMNWGLYDDEEGEEYEPRSEDLEEGYGEGEDGMEGDMLDEEEAFDEDLLAAGEMQNVPFL